MALLILSGVGGSTNWLPFMLPLVAILAAIKGSELLREWLHKRRIIRENKLSPFHAGDEPTNDLTDLPNSEH